MDKKYISAAINNVDNDEVLHYCVEKLVKNFNVVKSALAKEQNQLAAEGIGEMTVILDMLSSLDSKINGDKKTTIVA